MSHGGGFCERHGPFDPPYTTCPYCAREAQQRLAYGPPEATVHGHATTTADGDFARYIPLPPASANVNEAPPDANSEHLSGTEDATNAAGKTSALPLAWLIVKSPLEQRGVVLPVHSNQVIGREGDIHWDAPLLSRQHARFTLETPDDAPDSSPLFHVQPCDPAHPVYVNGEPIDGATPLQENDEIGLGETLFVFKVLRD